MHLSTKNTCAWQAHSPTTAGQERAMGLCISTIQWPPHVHSKVPRCHGDLDPYITRGSLDPHESAAMQHFNCNCFSSAMCPPHKQRDAQTMLCATSSSRPLLCTVCPPHRHTDCGRCAQKKQICEYL